MLVAWEIRPKINPDPITRIYSQFFDTWSIKNKLIKNIGVYSTKFPCALTALNKFSLSASPAARPDFRLVKAVLAERATKMNKRTVVTKYK